MSARMLFCSILLLTTASCEKAEKAEVCEVMKHIESYQNRKIVTAVEATFIENDVFISNPKCQLRCLYSKNPKAIYGKFAKKDLWKSIMKSREISMTGVSADMHIEGYILDNTQFSDAPDIFIIKRVLDYKMRANNNAPKVLCGNKMNELEN